VFSSRGTVRYEERGQGYRDVEKVGKHWSNTYNNAFIYRSVINLFSVPIWMLWTKSL